MAWKDNKIKELSKTEGVDPRVVRLVVDSPLKFSRERMADPNDWRPIMIRYFVKFVVKYNVEKENESKEVHNKDTFVSEGPSTIHGG